MRIAVWRKEIWHFIGRSADQLFDETYGKTQGTKLAFFCWQFIYLHNTLNLFPDSSKCLKLSTNQIPKKLKFKAARCLESGSLMLC
jgi:hypothetical protein